MPKVSQEEIQSARQMDLLTYLQRYEPNELVRVSKDTYCTREHDSLKISNGKWNWFSRGIGGRSALDYLTKVKEMPFVEAVRLLSAAPPETTPVPRNMTESSKKELLLPECSEDIDEVKKYLQGRGIHPVVVEYCIANKLLFQTLDYKNALFVGYDHEGKPRYGALRSTFSAYKSELSGSDKHYSFSIATNPEADAIHVFESAIDLLSYATMKLYEGVDWKKMALVSLAGVYKPKRQGVVPVALSRFLEENPQINTIHLHLDNDEVGRAATAGIVEGLMEKYTVLDEPPTKGKDVNEMLQLRVGIMTRDPMRGSCKAEVIEYDER